MRMGESVRVERVGVDHRCEYIRDGADRLEEVRTGNDLEVVPNRNCLTLQRFLSNGKRNH